jgi:hypothetical protein
MILVTGELYSEVYGSNWILSHEIEPSTAQSQYRNEIACGHDDGPLHPHELDSQYVAVSIGP